jgi:hypothetical protein
VHEGKALYIIIPQLLNLQLSRNSLPFPWVE